MLRILAIFSILTLNITSAIAAVKFEFNYNEFNTGFNDPTSGIERQQALEQAAKTFGSTALRNYNATITMDVGGSDDVASAGTFITGDPAGSGFGRIAVVRNKILSNGQNDINGNQVDGLLNVNFDSPNAPRWNLDTTRGPKPGELDFQTVMFHELTHAIGWLNTAGLGNSAAGSDVFGGGLTDGGEWFEYDRFLSDRDGNPLIDPNSRQNLNTQAFAALSTGGGIFFNGPHAMAANGGMPVSLFTPDVFEPGGSLAHLDPNNPDFANLLMLPTILSGVAIHQYSELELAILKDLGFEDIMNLSVVPLPAAFFMMLTGLFGLSWMRKRQNLSG